jgi:hypothetical protein
MTDVSLLAAGAVLLQSDTNGDLHPCTYFSHTFIAAEKNYNIYNQELLAVILTLVEWKHYLQGMSHPITVVTDHKNLSTLRTLKSCLTNKPDGHYFYKTLTSSGKSCQEPRWPPLMPYHNGTMWTLSWIIWTPPSFHPPLSLTLLILPLPATSNLPPPLTPLSYTLLPIYLTTLLYFLVHPLLIGILTTDTCTTRVTCMFHHLLNLCYSIPFIFLPSQVTSDASAPKPLWKETFGGQVCPHSSTASYEDVPFVNKTRSELIQ